MPASDVQCRRVLIAHALHGRFDVLADLVARLGHDAVVRRLEAADVVDIVAQEHPEVVLVGFAAGSELELVSAFVRKGSPHRRCACRPSRRAQRGTLVSRSRARRCAG